MDFLRNRSVMVFLVLVLLLGAHWGLLGTGATLYAAEDFEEGEGTIDEPFQITTAEQWNAVRNHLGSYFILMNDIDMSMYSGAAWVPIGTASVPFSGSVDGQNYKITNFALDIPSSVNPVGLFGVIASSGQIQNLNIEAVEVRGRDNVGILAGTNRGEITNVGVAGSVYGRNAVGGLVGLNEAGGNISGSHASGEVQGTRSVGGVAGSNHTSTVMNSYASSNVVGDREVGGLVGLNVLHQIIGSYATGDVTGVREAGGLVGANERFAIISNSHATGDVIGERDLGGLAGINQDGAAISLSNSAGDVTGNMVSSRFVGGLVGAIVDADISSSYATGNVIGYEYTGGLTGLIEYGNLTASYATGGVKGIIYTGGLVGLIAEGEISASYAAGNVTGWVDVGGLLGQLDEGAVSQSYAVGNVEGCNDVGGLVGDNDGLVSNSYATGSVAGIVGHSLCESSSLAIGGLVGDNKNSEIRNSYATGQVTGDLIVGGLVGENSDGTITNGYYNVETSGQHDTNGQGLASDEMKDRLNYVGWDFDTSWGMQAPHHDGYPYLQAIQAFVTYAGNGTDHSSEPYITRSYWPNSSVQVQEKSQDWNKAGYLYHDWNTAADGSGDKYRANDTIQLSGNILLYADWQQPAVPVFITPVDGSYTNNRLPAFSGSADAGVEVAINLDGSAVATVTSTGDGSWSWTPTGALAEGVHTVSAGVIDSIGSPTSLSAELTFTVDTTAPVITLRGEPSITLTAGTAFVDPGADVTDAEADIPVTITGSVDIEVPGTYTLQYNAADRAGNVAEPATRTVLVIARSWGGGSYQPSDNANLARLTVKATDEELALTPEFTAGTDHYRLETTAGEVTIEADAANVNATVTLDNSNLAGGKKITLREGHNEFEIKVRAENGAVKVYSLTIQRLSEGEPLPEEEPGEGPGQEPGGEPHEEVGCAFGDIKGHWAELVICEALEIGIVEGYSETAFQPQAYITRVEFAAILLRALGIHPVSAEFEPAFADREQIPAWAVDVIGTAIENGILQGYPDRTLRPMDLVSRSEMAAMMARALDWKGQPGDTTFADDAAIPAWAKGYVLDAVQRGLLQGRDGNRFSPADPATRAEATTLLLRLWHVLGNRR